MLSFRQKRRVSRMKKMVLLLLVLALMCTAGAAVAHPPSEVSLSYSRDEGILKVDAPHSVSDGKKHYINLFTVSVNGQVMYTLEPAWQVDGKTSTAMFQVGDLPVETVVEVEAICNRVGKKKSTLTVE
jgi:hypothetical protein